MPPNLSLSAILGRRHAEVYTTELVTKITTEKLTRLRTLYIDQLYRLKHVLKEKRRTYIHSLRAERETLCKCMGACGASICRLLAMSSSQ